MNCFITHSYKPFALKGVFLSLILFAFALKAIIPAGFMPGFAGGMTKMVICSGMGEKTVYVPNDDNTSPDHETSSKHCAYQISSSSKDLIPFLNTGFKVSENLVSVSFQIATANIQTRFAHAQNARAPPSLA